MVHPFQIRIHFYIPLGETDNIKAFMVDELFPRINGALEDLYGTFKIEQLPTMVWVTHEVVTKVQL